MNVAIYKTICCALNIDFETQQALFINIYLFYKQNFILNDRRIFVKKIEEKLSRVVPILCIVTSILVMLHVLNYIDNLWLVCTMSALTFSVSVLNLILRIKDK